MAFSPRLRVSPVKGPRWTFAVGPGATTRSGGRNACLCSTCGSPRQLFRRRNSLKRALFVLILMDFKGFSTFFLAFFKQALSSLLDLRSAIAEERFWPSEDTTRTQGWVLK